MAKVILARNRKKRLEGGHPWIYQSEVADIEGDFSPGDIVDIYNHQNYFLGRGYINPRSQIIVRLLTREREEIDQGFFVRRIRQALALRERFLKSTEACRLVYGEADFLPGLVVDKYGDYLVVQILALGMEVRRDLIIAGLQEVVHPRGIYERSDAKVRELEGLALRQGFLTEEFPTKVEFTENGLRFVADIAEGQKTGYFFDQRENRASIAPLMKKGVWGDQGATVLECFCHTGAFTVHAAAYGAKHITAVDISEAAIEMAKENIARNGFADGRVEFVVANAFDYLREQDEAGARYDVVILDPPAFTKSRHNIPGACRGYKEINLRGMRLLHPGGFLVTASCSYHMSPALFLETIHDAAKDAHKTLRLLEWKAAGKDHPQILGVDEGNYLKFAIFEVR